MKFLIYLILAMLFISSTLANTYESSAVNILREKQDHCLRLSGLSKDHWDLVRLDRKIYEDESQENFAVCLLKKLQILNMDGSIATDDVSPKLLTDNPEATRAARECVKLAGANVRETARKIMNCLLATDVIIAV